MASYRQFPPPPQSTFVQAPLPNQAHQPPGQGVGNQYSQNWGYNGAPGSSYPHQCNGVPMPPQFAPPPPPPDTLYQPPPPPSVPSQPGAAPSGYYPSSQPYSQYSQNQTMQPPPPSVPPPSSSVPPPPPPPASPPHPPSSAPPTSESKERSRHKDRKDSGWREPGKTNQPNSSRHRPPVASMPEKKSRGVETEEERRLRKKREYEKQRQEEKSRQQLKESQNRKLQKTQMLSSGTKGQVSISGSHIGERRVIPVLAGERGENRLKKPTTFLCKLK